MENSSSPALQQLEARVRVLNAELQKTAQEKQNLENQLELLLAGFQKLDFPKLVETLDIRLNRLEQRIEASERHTREELAGRFAVMIEPYLAKTASRLGDFNEQLNGFDERLAAGQKKLEKTHAAHRAKLVVDGADLVAELEKKGVALVDKLQKTHFGVQADLQNVSKYAAKLHDEVTAVHSEQKDVVQAGKRIITEVNEQIKIWRQSAEMIIQLCRTEQQEAVTKIDQASLYARTFASQTIGSYKTTLFVTSVAAVALVAVIALVSFWSIRDQSQNEIAEVKEFTAQEKQSIENIFAESVKAANIENTTDNLRIKLYPFLVSRLPAQFKKDFDKELAIQVDQLKNERIEKIDRQQQKSPPQIAQANAAQ